MLIVKGRLKRLKLFSKTFWLLDLFLYSIVVFTLMISLIDFIFYLIDWLFYFNIDSVVLHVNSTTSETVSQTTNVSVISNDGSWSSLIRSVFIYGSGGVRILYSRTPQGRFISTIGTVVIGQGSSIVERAANDPTYIRRQFENWKIVWDKYNSSVSVHPQNDTELINSVDTTVNSSQSISSSAGETSKSLLPDGLIPENLLYDIINQLKGILEPVYVSYSNELLAEQILGLAIVLFIMTIFTMILFISLIFNIFILIFSDKILNYFTNKYITWYIKLNKKIIVLEVTFLSVTILYSLYSISKGIHFIATHPFT